MSKAPQQSGRTLGRTMLIVCFMIIIFVGWVDPGRAGPASVVKVNPRYSELLKNAELIVVGSLVKLERRSMNVTLTRRRGAPETSVFDTAEIEVEKVLKGTDNAKVGSRVPVVAHSFNNFKRWAYEDSTVELSEGHRAIWILGDAAIVSAGHLILWDVLGFEKGSEVMESLQEFREPLVWLHPLTYKPATGGSFSERPRVLASEPGKYPQLAREAGIEGFVIVELFVNNDGSVREAQITESNVTPAMERAALLATSKFLFKPGKQNGKLVESVVETMVVFALQ